MSSARYVNVCSGYPDGTWFTHILFMTEHEKGLGRAKKLCLAQTAYYWFTVIK